MKYRKQDNMPPAPAEPPANPVTAYGTVTMSGAADLFSTSALQLLVNNVTSCVNALSMEEAWQVMCRLVVCCRWGESMCFPFMQTISYASSHSDGVDQLHLSLFLCPLFDSFGRWGVY